MGMATKREGVHATNLQTASSLVVASKGERKDRSPPPPPPPAAATTSRRCSSSRKGFTIYVGSWKGMVVTLPGANATDSVGRIKERVSAVDGTPADRQILLVDGRELEDHCTLEYYFIKNGSFLEQQCRRYVLRL